MIQNEFDRSVEDQIKQLFGRIQFSKHKNRKIFEKWKADYMVPQNFSALDSGFEFSNSISKGVPPSLSSGYQDRTNRHAALLQARKELFKQLQVIEQVLKDQGEEMAEKLLLKYTKTFPAIIKYSAFISLIVVLWFLWKAINLS